MSLNSEANYDLPKDPTTLIVATINDVETTIQAINDETVIAAEDLAGKLENTSQAASHNAAEHQIAQVTSEDNAGVASRGSETAKTEAQYVAQEGQAQQYDIEAKSHHVTSTAQANIAQDKSAASSAAERMAQIRVAVLETAQTQEIAISEIEVKTAHAVQEAMQDESAKGGGLDQETALRALTQENALTAPRLA